MEIKTNVLFNTFIFYTVYKLLSLLFIKDVTLVISKFNNLNYF